MRKEEKMARKREGGGRPPEMIVRDIIFGEPKSLPNKMYELGVSLLVLAGNWPAHGATYRFLVNGTPSGNEQLVVEGRASVKLTLPAGKAVIAVELRHPRFGVRLFSLAEKEIHAEEKKKKEVAKLEPIGLVSDEDMVYITLARLGNNGNGTKGEVAYFDPNDADVKSVKTDDNGVAVIKIDRSKTKLMATFYLPEKPGVKILQEIPAKKIPVPPKQKVSEPEKPKQTLSDRLKEAYGRGRQG